MTLVYLGRDDEIGEAELVEILRVAATVQMRPFQVGFDRYVSFRNSGPLPLVMRGGDGVPCVYELHDALRAALSRTGLAHGRPREFTPHLTLLRDEAVVPETLCDPISWGADSFALVSSPIGAARHDVLGRWALEATAAR